MYMCVCQAPHKKCRPLLIFAALNRAPNPSPMARPSTGRSKLQFMPPGREVHFVSWFEDAGWLHLGISTLGHSVVCSEALAIVSLSALLHGAVLARKALDGSLQELLVLELREKKREKEREREKEKEKEQEKEKEKEKEKDKDKKKEGGKKKEGEKEKEKEKEKERKRERERARDRDRDREREREREREKEVENKDVPAQLPRGASPKPSTLNPKPAGVKSSRRFDVFG